MTLKSFVLRDGSQPILNAWQKAKATLRLSSDLELMTNLPIERQSLHIKYEQTGSLPDLYIYMYI